MLEKGISATEARRETRISNIKEVVYLDTRNK